MKNDESIGVTHHQKRRVLEKLEKVENELKTTLAGRLPEDQPKHQQSSLLQVERETSKEAGTSETRAEVRSESEAGVFGE